MVAATQTKYTKILQRPEPAAFVLGKLIEGLSSGDIVEQMPARWPVTRRQVERFRANNLDKIQAAMAELQAITADVAIKASETRIREYAGWYEATKAYAAENGLADVTVRYGREGEVQQETKRFNASLVNTGAKLLYSVAEEMGDISRAAKVQVNVANEVRVYEVGTALPD